MADDFANQAAAERPDPVPEAELVFDDVPPCVSADGSTLISGGGTFGGSYNLLSDQPMESLGDVWGWTAADGTTEDDWQNTQWMSPALSPDGKYLAINGVAPQLALNVGGPGASRGLYKTSDGTQIPNTGLESLSLLMPAWSPDGKLITYMDRDVREPVDLVGHVGPRRRRTPGPQHRPFGHADGVERPRPGAARQRPDQVVHRLAEREPRQPLDHLSARRDARYALREQRRRVHGQPGRSLPGRRGEPWRRDPPSASSTATVGIPSRPGARDVSLNYEPTFAPVAAGGYFWVVFTSRRTYGNALTGDESVVKQLWVAAIDQANSGTVTAPNDPSHPPFLMPGQDNTSLNMRGYWALPPCQANGAGCASGTDCCNGYCNASGDAGGMTCASSSGGCSAGGDHCGTSSDCCGSATGATCINHVCSEATPRVAGSQSSPTALPRTVSARQSTLKNVAGPSVAACTAATAASSAARFRRSSTWRSRRRDDEPAEPQSTCKVAELLEPYRSLCPGKPSP